MSGLKPMGEIQRIERAERDIRLLAGAVHSQRKLNEKLVPAMDRIPELAAADRAIETAARQARDKLHAAIRRDFALVQKRVLLLERVVTWGGLVLVAGIVWGILR